MTPVTRRVSQAAGVRKSDLSLIKIDHQQTIAITNIQTFTPQPIVFKHP
jgi:hypothetical protein